MEQVSEEVDLNPILDLTRETDDAPLVFFKSTDFMSSRQMDGTVFIFAERVFIA